MEDSRELEVARSAAEAGGQALREHFRAALDVRVKDDGGLVSIADTEAEARIAAVILAHYPDHVILGEEAHRGDVEAPDLWVVDPLDGTTNFLHGIPHFAVSIAYFARGVAQCGVVFDPVGDEWYTAVRGGGAYHGRERARVGDDRRLDETLVGLGFASAGGPPVEATLAAARALFGRRVHGIRRFGTASLDLVAVGLGRFGAFFEYRLAPWDYAAGALFVEEAGGRVTDGDGATLPLHQSSVLATNAHLHDDMLEIMRAHAP